MDLSNAAFIENLYRDWQKDCNSVPKDWDILFSQWESSGSVEERDTPAVGESRQNMQNRVDSLIWAYRDIGYLYAQVNPLEGYITPDMRYQYKTIQGAYESLSVKEFGIPETALDDTFSAGPYLTPNSGSLRRILEALDDTYCSALGAEFLHIQNKPIRRWLIQKLEADNNRPQWSNEQRRGIQNDLIKV